MKQLNRHCKRSVTIPKILAQILFLTFTFTLLPNTFAQDQAKLDSLNQVLKTAKQDTVKINTLLKIGYEYEYQNPDTALIIYQKALKLAQKSKKQKLIAKSYYFIGFVYYHISDYEKTLEYWFKSLKINKELEDKDGIGEILGFIGLVYEKKGNYDKALNYFLQALKTYEDLGDKDGIAINLERIGGVYQNQSNYDKSLKYYLEALKIYKDLGDKYGMAINLGSIGGVYATQSDYVKALKYFFEVLKIYKDLGDKYGMAKILGNIGVIYRNQNNYTEALKYYLQALRINEELNYKSSIASNLNNIGVVYRDQCNYPEASKYFLKALEVNKELGNKRKIAINLGNIGLVYFKQNNYDKALDFYLKSLKISEELSLKRIIARNLGNIGDIYINKNNYEEALTYYLKSLKINKEIGNKKGIARAFLKIGNLNNKSRQYNKALEYIKKGLKITKEIGTLNLEKDAYYNLSETYIGLGNYKKALEYKDKWIELNDSIFNTEKSEAIAQMQFKFNYEKKAAIDSIATAKKMEIKDAEIAKTKAEQKAQETQRNMFIIAFALMLILAAFVFRSYRQKKKANELLAQQKQQISEANEELNQQNEEITAQRDEITEQKDKIEEIHHEISQSIDYATRLQGAILPEPKILEKYLSEYFVLFKPKDKVSGDFYWWSHVENHTIITAADSTGHGVPGAFMSMLGSSFLREIVQKEYVTHTGVILRKLRKEIIKSLKQKGEMGEQKDGMDMAIISINHETNIVQFSGANNPLYIVKSGKLKVESEGSDTIKLYELDELSTFKLYEVKPNKMPIAIYEKMDNFTTHEIQLEKGDILFMFSDGYADQFGVPKGKKFKYKPFKRLLLENANKPMTEQKEILHKAFEDWRGDLEQIDDVVVVGLKI